MNKEPDEFGLGAAYRGKIGRLPRKVRVDLSKMMEEGYGTRELLDWLHKQPGVGWCLVEYFGGQDITAQNLSNWRRGGHQHWLAHEERRGLVRELAAEGAELAKDAGGAVTAVLMAEFAEAMNETLLKITDPEARCQRLEGLLGTLIKVRRQDCASARRAREAAVDKELEEFKALCRRDWNKIGPVVGEAVRKTPNSDDESAEFKAVVAKVRRVRPDRHRESRLIKANQGSVRKGCTAKAPNSKLQHPEKLQTPMSKAGGATAGVIEDEDEKGRGGLAAGGGVSKAGGLKAKVRPVAPVTGRVAAADPAGAGHSRGPAEPVSKRRVNAKQAESRLIKVNQGSLRKDVVGKAPNSKLQAPEKLQTPMSKAGGASVAEIEDENEDEDEMEIGAGETLSREGTDIQAPSSNKESKAIIIADEEDEAQEEDSGQSDSVVASGIDPMVNATWKAQHGF